MSDRVKFGLSFGVIFLALAHAWLTAFLVRVPLPEESVFYEQKSFSFDTLHSGIGKKTQVNAAARDEIKQQIPLCVPCLAQVPIQAKPLPVGPKQNIDIFVGSDPQSQLLLSWFNTDPALVKLKSKVNFQAYAAGNLLYKSRYASQIPESQFPAIVFTRADGGHIHLASKGQIPDTPAALHSDLQASFEIYRTTLAPQAESNKDPNCPDGKCPVVPPVAPDESANRKPIFPLRNPVAPDGDDLFPGSGMVNPNMIEGFFRRSPIDLTTIVLVVLVIAIAYKFRQS